MTRRHGINQDILVRSPLSFSFDLDSFHVHTRLFYFQMPDSSYGYTIRFQLATW